MFWKLFQAKRKSFQPLKKSCQAEQTCVLLKNKIAIWQSMPSDKSKVLPSASVSESKLIDISTAKVLSAVKDQLKASNEENMKNLKKKYDEEINILRTEIIGPNASQSFLNAKYDDLQVKYEELRSASNKQSNELTILKSNSAELRQKTKTVKIDEIDQYSRRLNLEFYGVPKVRDEDVPQIVVNLSKKLGVDIQKHDISTALRMPKSFRRNSNPPAIIARFMNRDVSNEIYKNRITAKNIAKEEFPVAGMSKLYVNENLTNARKKLLWMTKQKAKELKYSSTWTMNGKIYVRKNENSDSKLLMNE